jgi:hypothetical protein
MFFLRRSKILWLASSPIPSCRSPNYSTLSRRAQDSEVILPALRTREPLRLVVDSTGLKVFGEGEWKVRKHGWSKRRTWRKVHLAMGLAPRLARYAQR